jgi:hypothetical protein
MCECGYVCKYFAWILGLNSCGGVSCLQHNTVVLAHTDSSYAVFCCTASFTASAFVDFAPLVVDPYVLSDFSTLPSQSFFFVIAPQHNTRQTRASWLFSALASPSSVPWLFTCSSRLSFPPFSYYLHFALASPFPQLHRLAR